jgi:hypothetical protein
LKPGIDGGVMPLGTSEALGAAVVAGGVTDSLDGAGPVAAVDAGMGDAGSIGWAFSPWLVSTGAARLGDPAGRCAAATGIGPALFVASGGRPFVPAGGVAAIRGGFDSVLLLLGSVVGA